MKKLVFISLLLLLNGCSHKNPLLNEDAESHIRHGLFYSAKYPQLAKHCRLYLLGKETLPNDKKAFCDGGVEELFTRYKTRDGFEGATLNDMHDPRVWMRVFRVRA